MKNKVEDKEHQKELLIEIMRGDEELGLYKDNKKECSVSYLINIITYDRLTRALTPGEWSDVYKKARKLHQEEVEVSFCYGELHDCITEEEVHEYAKEYYNDNYK